MAETDRINVVLPKPTHEVARFLARRRGTTVSDIVRTALSEYVHEELGKEKVLDTKMKEHGIA